MSNTANPTQHPRPLTDADVQWFGASHRLIGGLPDSRYGWLEQGDELFIVKAISLDLTAYAGTLLQHERQMLKRLAAINAPVPQMLDVGRDDWLVTRFGGLSLQRLVHLGGLQGIPPLARFGFAEQLAAWVHLLRRLQGMADKGVLAIDLYNANVVLPLTGTTQGQLRLHEAALIDHAHTLEAGMNMRRPVWLNHDMARIAPELQQALRTDQDALKTAFELAGAALPGYSRLPGTLDTHSRRVWAKYDAPQQLQQLLDQGSLSRDHAMQFAVGVALKRLLDLAMAPQQKQTLNVVVQRMTTVDASQRYPTLTQAADALASVVDALPLVSQHSYARLESRDLATPMGPDMPQPEPRSDPSTILAKDTNLPPVPAPRSGSPSLTPCPVPPDLEPVTRGLPLRWLYAAAALGAAWGTVWPLPWSG